MVVDIQIWHDEKIWSEIDYDPDVNQMETIELFAEALEALEPGERFTLIAQRL